MSHSPNPPPLLASMFATKRRAFATKADEILLPRQNAINCCSADPMRSKSILMWFWLIR
jgi:hypothetical protein